LASVLSSSNMNGKLLPSSKKIKSLHNSGHSRSTSPTFERVIPKSESYEWEIGSKEGKVINDNSKDDFEVFIPQSRTTQSYFKK
jgi:hypothetical protein